MRFPKETVARIEGLRERVVSVIVDTVAACEEFNGYDSDDDELVDISASAVKDLMSSLGSKGLLLYGNVGDSRIVACPGNEFVAAFGHDPDKFVNVGTPSVDGFIRMRAVLGDRRDAELLQRCFSALTFAPYGMRGISAFGGLISVYAPLSGSWDVVNDNMFMHTSDMTCSTYEPNGSEAVADLVDAVRFLVGLEC